MWADHADLPMILCTADSYRLPGGRYETNPSLGSFPCAIRMARQDAPATRCADNIDGNGHGQYSTSIFESVRVKAGDRQDDLTLVCAYIRESGRFPVLLELSMHCRLYVVGRAALA